MKKAIVLLSGGIDSTTTLAVAKEKGFEIYAISFDYGQRHWIELAFAKQCAVRFKVQKHLIMKFDLREIGGSALTSDIEVPKKSQKSEVPEKLRHGAGRSQKLNPPLPPFNKGGQGGIKHPSLIPITYVPARNTIFLSFALAFAESIGAEAIFIGANVLDYSGYPDCRPEFINAFENMANIATKTSVEGSTKFKIYAPLINFTKAEIIKKGAKLEVDFSLTWSCYDPQKRQNAGPAYRLPAGQAGTGRHRTCLPVRQAQKTDKDNLGSGLWALGSEVYVPCMRCDSCVLRAKGFKEAGIEDQLILKAKY
jgi:7-cyano-7-deazaguanine synthase